MFKRNGVYYALVSESCCYCGAGGRVHAFSAAAPLGPYTYQGEIAAGTNPFGGAVATSSQETNVFVAVDPATNASTWVWQGDRWQSSPDHLKAHDFTFWEPLAFVGDTVQKLTWQDTVNVNGG